MATHLARPHSHLSNRAKVRSALERKPVFKSVLENPFQISWPSVPTNVQNVVLARLVAALGNIPPRARASRKVSQKTDISSHQQNVGITEEVEHDNSQSGPSQALGQECTGRVSGASDPVIGINTVTKALESQLRITRRHVVVDNSSQNGDQLPAQPPVVAVFVCYADVDPPANVTHSIKLVPLPKGSESTISQILGVRSAAVIAFRHGSPLSEAVRDILDSVPIVSAPWLCPSDTPGTPQLVPTHIKQLRTTVPKDMKGAREQRSKARAAAKKNVSNSSRSVRRKPRVTLTTG